MSTKQRLQLAQSLAEIIPLDPETCNQMIDYGMTLKSELEIFEHFSNMLGESDATTEFLMKFMSIKNDKRAKPSIPEPVTPQVEKKIPKKAWTKPVEEPPKDTQKVKTKKPTSTITSDLLKSKEKEDKKDTKRSRRRNLDNLKDLEQLLNSLEVSNSKDSYKACYCNATRHPLFDIAPNCLNCGKIICAKEGLQPCSFCGHDLISQSEKQEIRKILLQEKQDLELKSPTETPPPETKHKAKKIVISMNAGENLWKAQDKALKAAEAEKKLQHDKEKEEREKREIQSQQEKELQYYSDISDKNPDLVAAQERLNTLLEFQENGTERTKIIDNAADYELTSNTGNMWLSATERALRLKKQQKQLRKYEENEIKRTGKGKRTVEMVIKDGKVTMVEKYGEDNDQEEDDQDIKELENQLKDTKRIHEQLLAQNVWDYEADEHKWEKPVYAPKETTKQVEDLPVLKPRVQFDKFDETELVVNSY